MLKERIIVIMGSMRDYPHASHIKEFIVEEGFQVECRFNVASAHKTPEKLLKDLKRYEGDNGKNVFITVAGLSDALSGVVAAHTNSPVIACPPDSEKYGWAKTFSTVATPKGVSVAYILKPENAALTAVKILALSNKSLKLKIGKYLEKIKRSIYDASKELEEKGINE